MISQNHKIVIGGDSLDTKVLCQNLKQEVRDLERRVNILQQEERPNLHCINHFADLLRQRRTVLRWVEERSRL
ncbi:hypothetical protein FKG94_23630 [Exilibacterium tricleocarpae]|uniref:Uncharacterized protein n=1 Tax=Exilibacterium tricleocarpae TaxID=2591008 RepID=A0A545STK2_9GAMM|nr:hypothetical protein [Exilibacterium tricleocarpae]TQV68285.1 hypothetical protein FKG94_23630 [Exilibacterium tricleocarpae]